MAPGGSVVTYDRSASPARREGQAVGALSFLLSFHLLLAPPAGHAQLEARGLSLTRPTQASLWAQAQARSTREGARGALEGQFRCHPRAQWLSVDQNLTEGMTEQGCGDEGPPLQGERTLSAERVQPASLWAPPASCGVRTGDVSGGSSQVDGVGGIKSEPTKSPPPGGPLSTWPSSPGCSSREMGWKSRGRLAWR